MKTKLIYALEALGILAFCCLPDFLEKLPFGSAILIIVSCVAVLLAGAKLCNREEVK